MRTTKKVKTQKFPISTNQRIIARKFPKSLGQANADAIAAAFHTICYGDPRLRSDIEKFFSRAKEMRNHPLVRPLWVILEKDAEVALNKLQFIQFKALVKSISWEVCTVDAVSQKFGVTQSEVSVVPYVAQKMVHTEELHKPGTYLVSEDEMLRTPELRSQFIRNRLQRCRESMLLLKAMPEIQTEVQEILRLLDIASNKA